MPEYSLKRKFDVMLLNLAVTNIYKNVKHKVSRTSSSKVSNKHFFLYSNSVQSDTPVKKPVNKNFFCEFQRKVCRHFFNESSVRYTVTLKKDIKTKKPIVHNIF